MLRRFFRIGANPRRYSRQLEKIKRDEIPPDSSPFSQTEDGFWKWAHTAGYRQHAWLRDRLPRFPDPAVQIRFTGQAGDSNTSEGFAAYILFKSYLDRHVVKSGSAPRDIEVLDFGCGWGRILRFWLRDLSPENIHGMDCLGEAIDVARGLDLGLPLCHSPVWPPAPYANDRFSLIYAFSVFSHLSEPAADAWIGEFHRLLRPGGILCVTTRERGFIVDNLIGKFEDRSFWLAEYDSGKFCHEPTGGGGELETSFYGETAIPREYVISHWVARGYELVDYLDNAGELRQNVIVLRKSEPGA